MSALVEYTVRGCGKFPHQILEYDGSEPATDEDEDVIVIDIFTRYNFFFFNNADTKTSEIIIFVLIKAGHLSRFTTN